jgi:hypothetical protein
MYERLILDATICCEKSPEYVPDPAAARTRRIQLNNIHNKLTYLSTVTEAGWKHVRTVFNKSELLHLYVWAIWYPSLTRSSASTHCLGYECKSKLDIQDVFYPGLTAPGHSVTVTSVL